MHAEQAPLAATDSLTASEIALIRDSFDRISVGLRFSRNFYAHLFAIAPEIRALFPDDISGQARKLMDMLAVLVGKLDRPHELVLTLEALGAQHRDYGVCAVHFAPVGRALFETLAAELGPRFDDTTRSAWIALYALASAWMQQSLPRERRP
jgi:hemoglobin-like flavoprotein